MKLLLFLLASVAFGQQTIEEIEFAERNGYEMLPPEPPSLSWYLFDTQFAPLPFTPAVVAPPLESPKYLELAPASHPLPVRTARLQFELDYARGTPPVPEPSVYTTALRFVSSDDDVLQSDIQNPLPVQLAVFQPPVRLRLPTTNPGSLPGAPCLGVCVTFSSQGDAALQALTGKGLTNFQIIEALVCSPTHPADIPAGLILQLANTVGIQTIQSAVGSAIVQQRVGLNWRAIIINSLKYGSIMALGIMSSGVFGTVSKGAIFATALGHEAADDLPKLLAPGAPNPDPFLTNVLDGSKSVHVLPTACGDVLFSGVYGGPGTSFVTNPIQVMP